MAFRGHRKPNKHKKAKTKPTQPKLATRTKRQTRRKTTRPTKRTGNIHRIRTQIAAANLPPKRAEDGESGRTLFSLYFVGNGELALRQKPYKGKNGSQKL